MFRFFVTCARGTEGALQREIADMRIAGAKDDHGGVWFEGPLEIGMRVCLYARVTVRVAGSAGDVRRVGRQEPLRRRAGDRLVGLADRQERVRRPRQRARHTGALFFGDRAKEIAGELKKNMVVTLVGEHQLRPSAAASRGR